MKYLAFMLLLTAAAACNKAATNSSSQKNITGKWLLTETLADPGDGSGKWTPVNSLSPSYIQFTLDGKFISTSYFSQFDQYHLNADSTKIILSKSTNPDTLELFYTLKGAELTINPQCIEACGFRFKKLK